MTVKTCTKCGETKPVSEFYAQKGCHLGVRPSCKECDRRKSAEYRKLNPEKAKAAVAKWKEANPDRKRELDAKWNAENRDKVRERSAKMRAEDPERVRKYAREWARKKQEQDSQYRLAGAIKASVRKSIKDGGKSGRRTFALLGYSQEELRTHLEAGFSEGMTWENYGRGGWHVDHILPLASFDFKTPDCPDFKRAWALSNLQPLWEPDNCSKRDRLDHPSQASLLAA